MVASACTRIELSKAVTRNQTKTLAWPSQMSGATWDTEQILSLAQQHSPLLTAIVVLGATYLFLKRIQQSGRCPFAGASAGAASAKGSAVAGGQKVCEGPSLHSGTALCNIV